MDTIGEIRLENLELLIRAAGKLEALAAKAETSSVYLSQIRKRALDSKTKRPREMGNDMARRIEKAHALPIGWMDRRNSPPHDYQLTNDGRVVLPGQVASDLEDRFRLSLADDPGLPGLEASSAANTASPPTVAGIAEQTRSLAKPKPNVDRTDAAEHLADALGDALQGLPAAMYDRAVTACRRLAESPDSLRARAELRDVLQHSEALYTQANSRPAFRVRAHEMAASHPDPAVREILTKFADAVDAEVARGISLDTNQDKVRSPHS